TDADRAALTRECEVLALGEHPRLPRLLRRGEGDRWIALPRVRGATFDRWSARVGVVAIVDAALQVVEALRHLQRHGVVHGDLKPGNLLVDPHGDVTLIDLGVAVLPGEERRRFRGTLGFAAPELLRGEPASHRADLY